MKLILLVLQNVDYHFANGIYKPQVRFLVWLCLFILIHILGSIGYEILIGSENGLAPYKTQAMTWTNDD